ncbi:hypothetical protein D3C73_1304530 [compost metagenome]
MVVVRVAQNDGAVRPLGEHDVGADLQQFGLVLQHLGVERGSCRHIRERRVPEHGRGREDSRCELDAGRLGRE